MDKQSDIHQVLCVGGSLYLCACVHMHALAGACACMCVCVCVRVRVHVWVCMCVCVWSDEGGTIGSQSVRSLWKIRQKFMIEIVTETMSDSKRKRESVRMCV